MQNHLTDHNNAAVSIPRGHGKTDQVSIGRTSWEIGRNQSIRIKVFKNADDEASKVVDATRRVIMSQKYRMVFPEVTPDRNHWQGSSFRVNRPNEGEKEPTYQAYGIFGSYTGGRADIILEDDICDLKNSIQNPANREKIRELVRNSVYPMGVKGCKRWRIYTPYHVSDATADYEKSKSIACLRMPIIGFKSVWPSEFPSERLREIYDDIGEHAFARAYRLLRISDADIMVRKEWLENAFYEGLAAKRKTVKVASLDFAFTRPRMGGLKKSNASGPDWSVIIVCEVDEANNVWLTKLIRVQITYPEFKNLILEHCQGCEYVLGEDVAGQRGLLQDLAATTKFNIRYMLPSDGEIGRNTFDKKGRLAAVTPMIESGKLHIPAVRINNELKCIREFEPLYDELSTFPVCEYFDCADACTQLLRFVKMGHVSVNKKDESKEREALYGINYPDPFR